MGKVKNTIPVIDICNLDGDANGRKNILAADLATYITAHPALHKPHRHSCYHFVLFTDGVGSHSIDFEQFRVKPGQVYFMAPGQVHSWNFKNNINGYIVNFSEDLITALLHNKQYLQQFSFFKGIAADSVVNLTGAALQQAKTICSNIIAETAGNNALQTDMISSLLISFFITVQRESRLSPSRKELPQSMLVLSNFRSLVDEHFTEMKLPKEYAALLYITPNHLNALCNDLLGKSAGEVIRDRVLLEAKRLLVNAGSNISEIAYSLGFIDNSHFSKFFKKYEGLTPEAFRKNILKEV